MNDWKGTFWSLAITWVVFGVLGGLVWGAFYAGTVQAKKKDPYEDRKYVVKVIRWIDGDTPVVDIYLGLDVYLHNQHLRLNRVDTPERGHDDFETATHVSRTTCPVNQEASIQVLKRGKYGRWIVEMDCRGTNLNDKLRARGWKYE